MVQRPYTTSEEWFTATRKLRTNLHSCADLTNHPEVMATNRKNSIRANYLHHKSHTARFFCSSMSTGNLWRSRPTFCCGLSSGITADLSADYLQCDMGRVI